MFCPDCGKQTPEGKRFCIHCGADIKAAVTPPPVTPPPVTPPPTPAGSISDEDTVLRAEVAEVFKAGDVIDDRYEVRSVLGTGGMGAVHHVHDRDLEEDCALKAMHPHLLASEKAAERFVQEVRLSRKLSHANVVRVHHLGQWGGLRYLTMELLQGTTLREWLVQLRQEGRQVPLEVATSITGQVLEGLAYAHRHTIHRDIKPENIFLTGAEPGFKVKLLDFGIAKALDKEALTSTTTSMGTAYYVAPEQLRGDEEIDPRADLYAVGVVLYEMLTGELPTGRFAAPSEVRDDLDAEWDEFVLGAMERDAEKRPASAEVMAEGLRTVLRPRGKVETPPPPVVEEKKPVEVKPEPPLPKLKPQPIPQPKRRKGATLLWVVAVFAVVAAVVVVWQVAGGPGEEPWTEEPEVVPEPPPEFPEEPEEEGKPIFGENPFDEPQGEDLAALFREARDVMEQGDFEEAHELLDAYEAMGGDPDRATGLRQEIFQRSVESVRDLVPGAQAFDRMVRAYGGGRPDVVRAYSMGGTATFTQQGLSVSQEYLMVFPDRMYSMLMSPGMTSSTIVNGDRGIVMVNGNPQPMTPENIRNSQELLKRDLYFMAANHADPGLLREYVGPDDVNGTACDNIQVVWDGVESRICIAEDGRVLRLGYLAVNPMTQQSGINMVIVTDFQRFDGRLVPMRAVHYFNGEEIGYNHVTKVEFNPLFDEEMFWIPGY
jgi:serine/threonine protein kinase